MAQLKINIPNNKVALICKAFTEVKGIGTDGQTATPAEVRQEIISEIKQVVRTYQMRRLQYGQVDSLSQADLLIDVTGED